MDEDFYKDFPNAHFVQFVGGHSDGVEMSVLGLNQEFYFRVFDLERHKQEDLDKPVVTRREVYVLLPGTTIYVFQRME